MKIAILGAPGTGKTELAQSLLSAMPTHCLLVDTLAFMTALCSDLVRDEDAQIADALNQLDDVDMTLVMGMDRIPAARDVHRCACSRENLDARLRALLSARGIHYLVIYGTAAERASSALQAITHHAGRPSARPASLTTAWQWTCEKCSDARCEHRMFTDRLKIGERSAAPP